MPKHLFRTAFFVTLCLVILGAFNLGTSLSQTTPEAKTNSGWPKAGVACTNSLGVQMVPAGTDGVLFSVFDVRLQDFRKFAQDTGLVTSSEHMYCYQVVHDDSKNSSQATFVSSPDANWQSPGFSQAGSQPVVGISWDETQLFCQWLAKRDQASGLIRPQQAYRLPNIAEWNRAAGQTTYSWGETWPPTREDGNFRDASWMRAIQSDGWNVVPVDDGYGYTSPVGSFKPNDFGLYDMGGNVFQMSNELDPKNGAHHLWRGSSWCTSNQNALRLDNTEQSCGPSYRYSCLGFRIVLVTAAGN